MNLIHLNLSGKYMEVGEIRLCNNPFADGICIEIRIANHFATARIRPECQHPRRLSLINIVKQLLTLSENTPISLLIMGDDEDSDPANWAPSLYLLLTELRRVHLLRYAIMYTKYTVAALNERADRQRTPTKRTQFRGALRSFDILVQKQANRYADPTERCVTVYTDSLVSKSVTITPYTL